VFAAEVGGERERAIMLHSTQWVNGTVLHYAFFDDEPRFAAWRGTLAQQQLVRDAIASWTAVGMGVRFEEVADRGAAEVRIGFMAGDGHWSYVGRDVLRQGVDDRTLNLDVSASNLDLDTACHELGHTLGLPHEHQNPHAGIVWDEEAVYAALAAPPNRWDRETTFHNILRKLPANQLHGSTWDPDSIMHYAFGAGLIKEPQKYRKGLTPAGGLSGTDREWIQRFYPLDFDESVLPLLESRRLRLEPGGQRNFLLQPKITRTYTLGTFGDCDTVAVLFERSADGDVYLSGDDDSGEERNARMRRRLHRGRTYVMRIRLQHAANAEDTAVMWW
jgi:hypothetical protein